MLRVEEYVMYSLKEIEIEPDSVLKRQILTLRNLDLERMSEDRFARKFVENYSQCSIYEIEQKIELASHYYESQSLFPGDTVLFYPTITEQKASCEKTCDVYGGKIHIGSYYLRYQAFMENLTTGKKYVLKRPWIAEMGTYDFFPSNISEMDSLDVALKTAYELGHLNSRYDYYSISTRIGAGVYVTKLGPKNKVKQKIREQKRKLAC